MEITLFAKKATTKEGKSFYRFLSRLNRKDGTVQPVTVKFSGDCKLPKGEDCPMNIIVDKKNSNLASSSYLDEKTGETKSSYTLWVNDYKQGSAYVDHSLDDFQF